MAQKIQEIEARGTDVEEAINSGLATLGVSRDKVEIEILDEGRRGLLGIGGREAVVRLRTLPAPEHKPAPVKARTAPEPVPSEAPLQEKPAPPATPGETPVPTATAEEPLPVKATAPVAQAAADDNVDVAVTIVRELLDKMQVDATVSSRLTEPDDLTGRQMPIIDVNGDDLGGLIGPRGETLDALQYVSRLMVGQKIQGRAHFVIDIDGYRERREQALTRMAERMAGKAVKRGSPVTLEAMSPYERRVIHMALRDLPEVTTESTGEGKRRRVRIYPKVSQE